MLFRWVGGLLLGVAALSASAETPEAFFERFVKIGQRYDLAVAELYADDAVIRSLRKYPLGASKTMDVSGVQWKALIKQVMPSAKLLDDKSLYSNMKFTLSGDDVKVKADRYVPRRCYTDKGYYLVIRKQQDGRYLIVEEYLETEAAATC